MLLVMSLPANLDQLSADELRQLAQQLAAQVESQAKVLAENGKELHWRQTKIDQLTHELALHKRWRLRLHAQF